MAGFDDTDDAIAGADQVFSWGVQQTRMLANKYPRASGKIATEGNPRWDLLRPEWREFYRPEADALRSTTSISSTDTADVEPSESPTEPAERPLDV